MAITSGLFNSRNGDRRYDAKWFARYFATFIGNGVFPNPSTGLQVVQDDNMRTVVRAGDGWINGYFIVNDSNYVLQHDIADGVLKRIDRIVLRLDFAEREILPVIKKGVFASNPVAPSLQRDADFYELALADVLINNGATFISQANITDTRLNKALCGIVHGTVDQVDTTTLFNQYQSWMEQQKTDYESDFLTWSDQKRLDFDVWQDAEQTDFDIWFAGIQDILDENVAASLQLQINQLATDIQALDAKVDAEIDAVNGRVTAQLVELDALSNAVTAHTADLTSQELGKGASLIGVHDADSLFTATTVEGALKESLTQANAAFTSASNGKGAVGAAITGVDDAVVIPPEPTFNDLAAAIGSISTGKKWASGSFSVNNNGDGSVSTLVFKPKIIIIRCKRRANNEYTNVLYNEQMPVGSGSAANLTATEFDPHRNTAGPLVSGGITTNIEGFVVKSEGLAGTIDYIAFE